jgi:hypothetical protein
MARFEKTAAKDAIATTLAADHAKTVDEAYVEIYRRLRDGDIANADSSKDHVDATLSPERYDLSKVGRFHFNRRFGLSTKDKDLGQGTLSADDLARIIIHIAEQNAILSRSRRHRPPRFPPRTFRRRASREPHARRTFSHEAQHPGPHGDG